MGTPMATRLVNAGYRVQAWDQSPDARARFQEISGLAAVENASSAAAEAAAVVLMLPDSAAVKAALADDQLINASRAGAMFIDMGSSDPMSTRALSDAATSDPRWQLV